MIEQTLAIIKPDAVKNKYSGKILSMIEDTGFKIVAMRKLFITEEMACSFYVVHKEKGFYNDLVKFMTSGSSIVMVLEKENAVLDYRKLMGATNPKDAENGTIRKLYASSIEANAVHGSDSKENATVEINFFFSKSDIIQFLG